MRDRSVIAKELTVAQWHLDEGERRIRAQLQVLERLRRLHKETRLAMSVLVTLQAAQALCVADRDRLQRELGRVTPVSAA